jgi:hypothetical protein
VKAKPPVNFKISREQNVHFPLPRSGSVQPCAAANGDEPFSFVVFSEAPRRLIPVVVLGSFAETI